MNLTGYINPAQKLTGTLNGALIRGKSAYEYAVEGGFSGSEEEFAQMLNLRPRLVAKFTVSGNPIINVQSANIQSSTFTATGHGLSDGDIVMPVLKDPANPYYPMAVFPAGLPSTAYLVASATANTFKLKNMNGADVTLSDNGTMDLSKWHFENVTRNFAITGLPGMKKCQVVMKGINGNNSWYLVPNGVGATEQIWLRTGGTTYTYGITGIMGSVYGRSEILIDYTDYLTVFINSLQVRSNAAASNSAANLIEKLYTPKYKNGTITELNFWYIHACNGLTVEVYALD